ncbi:MAG: extracellular solute-binding protein, partial [Caldicoprobacterales bacterium]
MKGFLRYFSIIMCLAILIGAFTACSGNQNSSEVSQSQGQANNQPSQNDSNQNTKDTQDSGDSNEPVKIIIWGGVPEENGPSALVEEFNKTHEGIVAEYVRFVNDETGNTKLDTALLSGEQIDVYFTYSIPIMTKRIEGGMAEDLSNFDADTFVKENIGEEGVFKYDNKYYSIPTAKEPYYIMLNKAIFDELGIDIPTEWTVDEYREICKKLVDESGDKKRYAIHGYLDLPRMVLGDNYWYKADAQESNFDDPIFAQSYQLYHDMMYEDGSAFPYTEVLARKMEAYAQDLFLTEEVAMMLSAPWHLRYVRDTESYPHDWVATFAPLPVLEKGKEYYNLGTLNNWIMMNSKSEHKEAAWEFIKYWLTDGSKFLLAGGKVPVW